MKLNQLRFASAVASTGSFSRAAKLCHVAQPTLSQGIAQLESELGAPLFERNTRCVAPSPFGRHVLPLIDQVLGAVGDLESSAKAYLHPTLKILRIGLSPLIDMQRLTYILEPFQRANPEVKVFFKQCFLADLEHRLQTEQIDIALWPELDKGGAPHFTSAPLYDEPLMFVPCAGAVPKTGSARHITIGALAGETFVLTPDLCGLVRVTRRLFREAGAPLIEYPGQALSYDVMQEWADLGIGAAVLPASKLKSERLDGAIPLGDASGHPLRLMLVASWNPSASTPPHIKALRTHIVDIVPRSMAGYVY